MPDIQLQAVCKNYGGLQVIHEVSMDVHQGEMLVFVGPSGCGKSTLLRMVAGLEEISGGTLRFGDKVMNDVRGSKRGVAMVFQSYALYPHMSVEDNMSFNLKVAGVGWAERHRRVKLAADMLQLTPYLARRPRELSGGQRQRVAIGRAIVREAEIFLFDEPLSNLDAALRISTRAEIAKLKKSLPDTTMIYVTHDQVEAMTLADRIVVLNAGQVEQIGTPEELYRAPRNRFVAGFIGAPSMNLLEGDILPDPGGARIRISDGLTLPSDSRTDKAERGAIGLRPEMLRLADPQSAEFEGRVDLVEYLGDVAILHIVLDGGALVLAKMAAPLTLDAGQMVHLSYDHAAAHLFGADGNRL
ncbi:sn-glycerol-3-phosphate ABC transporter ATP-binding protein UgpC [Rhodophyticola sp. CCM32]|uniref:ABC transporter ATP-binding protein n=1 Tax=Rhodophyticola sp. CCM32 TaxID=2916397 RepID=UPI00107FA252|nr:sn-glycerol-3-phosphate ABC transporter ATP-binding protein UgpC [Rhodophyticola sp. CCM32]QBY01267.1 sn-glycerol-3-phosphate ABC transporter ATP-binding protein UgpC [Rhodophyticola sp. CCM32]